MSEDSRPYVAPGATIVGDVRLAPTVSVWFGTTVRGEAASVQIDEAANVQDNCLVEALPGQPVRIGSGVTVGHNARISGATIEERALIAIGSTVEPGAVVGAQSIVAANAIVPAGMIVPPRRLVIGSGRILREVSDAEITRIDRGAREYVRLGREYLSGDQA